METANKVGTKTVKRKRTKDFRLHENGNGELGTKTAKRKTKQW